MSSRSSVATFGFLPATCGGSIDDVLDPPGVEAPSRLRLPSPLLPVSKLNPDDPVSSKSGGGGSVLCLRGSPSTFNAFLSYSVGLDFRFFDSPLSNVCPPSSSSSLLEG
eukprot:CAMPEP_0184742138 /NCGR_PEP_ID=MMETSP0315-20130426/5160_1 /TAXON_ID=101924 /ORGANISM="Rhodosorus marinus, Strain UTEX LB 2760" /LENGTH=108 /DNA_ID=CAMNT_0027212857 /DNA_START=617 /DNA_END=943 /DNA_ORIENTATION=-